MDQIKSKGQYNAHAQRRTRVLQKWHRIAFHLSLTELYTDIRGQPNFPVETGNLQHSVGVPGPIPTAKDTLAHLPSSPEAVPTVRMVRKTGQRWQLFVHVGMVYARAVLKDGESPLIQQPLERFIPRVKENFDDATARAAEELAR